MNEISSAANDGYIEHDPAYEETWAGTEYSDIAGDWDAVVPTTPETGEEDIDDTPPETSDPHITICDREEAPAFWASSPKEVTTAVRQLGPAIAAESVVIGSSAAYVALGNDVRAPRGLDVSVSSGAYAHLRAQPGWEERDGRLYNGAYDVGLGWGNNTHAELANRAWETESGIKVASLSDVVSWKTWARGSGKDLADVAAIRERLLDPTKPPLPNEVITDEISIARACLPEHLRDDPEAQVAIELAANGLATVRALYGDGRIGRTNLIVGELERPEYRVAATYHNGFDLPKDMRRLQVHMDNIGATDEQRLEAMVADTYSDIVYGNGRKHDNPEGYDELRSANLLAAHVAMKGYDQARAESHRQSVLGTTFDERTGSQTGRRHPSPVVRAVAGIDLQTLSEPDTIAGSIDLCVENGMSARFSPARTIGQAAVEQGVRISSTEEGLQFIDEYPGLKPADAPDGPTIKEAFVHGLAGNAHFVDPVTGYTPPDGWTLENKAMRTANAAKLRGLSGRLAAGDITAQQAYSEAKAYAETMGDIEV